VYPLHFGLLRYTYLTFNLEPETSKRANEARMPKLPVSSIILVVLQQPAGIGFELEACSFGTSAPKLCLGMDNHSQWKHGAHSDS
jgi:hypothetical protein